MITSIEQTVAQRSQITETVKNCPNASASNRVIVYRIKGIDCTRIKHQLKVILLKYEFLPHKNYNWYACKHINNKRDNFPISSKSL